MNYQEAAVLDKLLPYFVHVLTVAGYSKTMFTLILLVIIGLSFGYFATMNTMTIPVNIAGVTYNDVPLYIVLGITLLLGLALSWVISMVDSVYTSMAFRGKDRAIRDRERTVDSLSKQVHDLEVENAKLRGRLDEEHERDHSYRKASIGESLAARRAG